MAGCVGAHQRLRVAEQVAQIDFLDAAIAHGRLHVGPQLSQQRLGVELHVVEHLFHGVALDQGVQAGGREAQPQGA